MGNAQGQFAAVPHPLQGTAQLLKAQGKVNFLLHHLFPTYIICFDRITELTEAVDGVVELGDCFVEGICREIRQQLLKLTERQRTFIKVCITFRCIQTKTAQKVGHSPELAIRIPIAIMTLQGGDETQRSIGTVTAAVEETGDSAGMCHNLDRVLKHIFVAALQNIYPTGVGGDL